MPMPTRLLLMQVGQEGRFEENASLASQTCARIDPVHLRDSLMVLPELFAFGQRASLEVVERGVASGQSGEGDLAQLAKRYECWAAGGVPFKDDRGWHNTAVVFKPD